MQAITKVFSDIVKPYIDAEDENLQNQVTGLIDNSFANGAVNLFPTTATTQVVNGITFTINSDGTITANGTSTAEISFSLYGSVGNRLFDTGVLQKGKSYKISGTPSEITDAYMYLRTSDGATRDSGEGAIVNTSLSTTGGNFAIAMAENVTLNNVVFKPMITLADMPNSDYNHYVPYAKSNQSLTKETTALIDNQAVNGAVNIAPFDGTSQLISGVNVTFNTDGSITADGANQDKTATANIRLHIGYFTLHKGIVYKVSANKDGSIYSEKQGRCIAVRQKSDMAWKMSTDKMDNNDAYYMPLADVEMEIILAINTGLYVNNLTFYPMVTVASYNGGYVPYGGKSNKELTEIVEPLKTQFDNEHNYIIPFADIMNIYWTNNAIPSDFSNLTTQQATDLAQALYDLFKKIGGAAWIRYSGLINVYDRKASDSSQIYSTRDIVDIYSNINYDSMLSNNNNARFTLVRHPYGSAMQVTYALWGNKLMYSNHGIDAAGNVADIDKLYTYNTISTYKG